MLRCLTSSVARRCYRESSNSRVRPKRSSSCDARRLVSRRARARSHVAWLGATGTFDPGRLQPARCSALRPSETKSRSLDVHACLASTPFRAAGPNPSSSRWELPRRPTLLRLAFLAAHRSEPGRCVLPASATDLRHEHPQTVRFPGERLTPDRPHIALTHVQSDRAAFCILAETEPQVDTCLTACVQLWRNRPQPYPEEGDGRAPHRAMLPRRGVFNRVRGCSI
jgi:hypothetical protein